MSDLPRQMQLMQTFLNTKSQHQNPQIVWSRFSNFMQLLTLTNSYVVFEITLKSITCAMCPNKVTEKNEIVSLACCQATVCGKECFRQFVHSATNGTLLNLECVVCPRCSNYLGRDQCLSYFTEWEIYTSNQKVKQAPSNAPKVPGTFKCLIHIDDVPDSEAVRLQCGHGVCKECMQSHIESQIELGKASITCPCNDCPTVITDWHVRTFTPKLLSLFLKMSLEGAKICMAGENESIFQCPSLDCSNMIIVPKTVFSFTCPMCQKKYCPQCQNAVHIPMTCVQYFQHLQDEKRRQHQLQEDEKATDDYFRNLPGKKYRQCPVCKVWIERTEGCKFMKCLSPTCQGKTYFCMECKTRLKEKHGKHKCTVEGWAFLEDS